MDKPLVRTGDSALVSFEFMFKPEYIEVETYSEKAEQRYGTTENCIIIIKYHFIMLIIWIIFIVITSFPCPSSLLAHFHIHLMDVITMPLNPASIKIFPTSVIICFYLLQIRQFCLLFFKF